MVCGVRKLLQVLKQRENKTQASYIRKYPKQGSFLQFSKVAAKL